MLDIAPHDRAYLADHLDELEAVVTELSFNVQDDHWLVYCHAMGREHLDLPEINERVGLSEMDPFRQAA